MKHIMQVNSYNFVPITLRKIENQHKFLMILQHYLFILIHICMSNTIHMLSIGFIHMIWLIHVSEYLEWGGVFHILHAMLYI